MRGTNGLFVCGCGTQCASRVLTGVLCTRSTHRGTVSYSQGYSVVLISCSTQCASHLVDLISAQPSRSHVGYSEHVHVKLACADDQPIGAAFRSDSRRVRCIDSSGWVGRNLQQPAARVHHVQRSKATCLNPARNQRSAARKSALSQWRSHCSSGQCRFSRAVLCCAVLCCAVLCSVCCAVLRCAALRCAVLCCAVLCCAVQCSAHRGKSTIGLERETAASPAPMSVACCVLHVPCLCAVVVRDDCLSYMLHVACCVLYVACRWRYRRLPLVRRVCRMSYCTCARTRSRTCTALTVGSGCSRSM